jgi:hypothetical protein
MTDQRHTIRRVVDPEDCDKNCLVCYRLNLQVKWIIAVACFACVGLGGMATAIEVSRQDIKDLSTASAVTQEKLEYVVSSVNDIKKSMGLEIRMPPKLEALKN